MKYLTVILLLFTCFFYTGCAVFTTNPYEKQLNVYKMQIAKGRDKALEKALEATWKERVEVEKQYQKKILEYNILLTAYARDTGKTVNEVKTSNVLSQDYIWNELNIKENEYTQRVDEINKTYQTFFDEIKKEDAKVESLDEAIKKIDDERKETYYDILKTFISAITIIGIDSYTGIIK
jgi:hypothetical protein